MLKILVLLFCMDPTFSILPAKIDVIKEKSLYADYINHNAVGYLKHDRDTNAHESTHFINSALRNRFKDSNKLNAFYVGQNRYVTFYEPNIKKSDVIKYVPKSLHYSRFDLYLRSKHWEEKPLYVLDEWISYTNGLAVTIEDIENNRQDIGWTNSLSGPLELGIYSIALCEAISIQDELYWEKGIEFKLFMKWSLKRSQELYERGRDYKTLKDNNTELLLNKLRTSEDAKVMRKFIDKEFDGVLLNRR